MSALNQAPEILTERLRLRRPVLNDAPTVASLVSDIDIPRMTTRIPWPYGLSEAQSFLQQAETFDPERDRVFMIETPEHGVIGAVGLHTHERLPEIGYWIGREHWGKGYATEAATASLKWAHEQWGRKAVLGGHFDDNPASAAVLNKAGFLYTGAVEKRHSLARGEAAPTRVMLWIA